VAEEKRTPLYDEHVAAGAKLAPFAGYVMPIEYTGIIAEHRAVRSAMGMFDLSHMGEFIVSGEGALEAVDRLMTNEITSLDVGQVRYTPMCLDSGGIVDDLLVYRFPDRVMLVVNASNIEKDWEWITSHLPSNVRTRNVSDDIALIAVQGPDATTFVQSMTDVDLTPIGYYHFREGKVSDLPATISRTGYTGEDGLELYVEALFAADLWEALVSVGKPRGLALAGLGARDTLRLEAGLALYGNDIDETTTPLESGLGWTVKLEGRDFVGADSLRRQKAEGLTRRLAAFEMLDRAIPRPHYMVDAGDSSVGEVTSGTFSPTFGTGLGLAYLPPMAAKVGTAIEIDIRGQRHPARVVKKPIYQRSK
jgi:aminomethyltransferase